MRKTLAWSATALLGLVALLTLFLLLLFSEANCFLTPGVAFLKDFRLAPWKLCAFAAFAGVVWTLLSWTCYFTLCSIHRRLSGEAQTFGQAAIKTGSLWGFVLWGTLAFLLAVIVDLQQTSVEAISKGNLGAFRSALSVYYGDEKTYPRDVAVLTRDGKYLSLIPTAKAPGYHAASSHVSYRTSADDSGGWGYNNVPGHATFGALWINCTHIDSKGRAWSSY